MTFIRRAPPASAPRQPHELRLTSPMGGCRARCGGPHSPSRETLAAAAAHRPRPLAGTAGAVRIVAHHRRAGGVESSRLVGGELQPVRFEVLVELLDRAGA